MQRSLARDVDVGLELIPTGREVAGMVRLSGAGARTDADELMLQHQRNKPRSGTHGRNRADRGMLSPDNAIKAIVASLLDGDQRHNAKCAGQPSSYGISGFYLNPNSGCRTLASIGHRPRPSPLVANASSTSRSLSLPNHISSPIKKVGEPKVPRATERSVDSTKACLTSDV